MGDLAQWLMGITRSNKDVYIDGMPVNINSLIEPPDIMMMPTSDSVRIFVKYGGDRYYTIRCKFYDYIKNHIKIDIVVDGNRLPMRTHKLEKHISEKYGPSFNTNFGLLHRLVAVIDPIVISIIDEEGMLTKLESSSRVKRAI